MTILEIIDKLKDCKVTPKLQREELKLVGEVKNLTTDFIEIVKKNKFEIIEFIKKSTKQFVHQPIRKITNQDHYPLSSAQKSIWLACQFKDALSAYNIVNSFYLKGILTKPNLNKAFTSVINRHESLRTIFKTVNGIPYQYILKEFNFELDEEDISNTLDLYKKLEYEVELFSSACFQLELGLLIKAKLIQISDSEYALILATHHIITDGWSIAVLMQEVMALYESYCKNKDLALQPLAIQYKDYCYWLQQKIANEEGENNKKYWQNRLEEMCEPLLIPSDRMRPQIKSFKGAIKRFNFSTTQTRNIQLFCEQFGISLFNLLYSLVAVLLYKYSGQRKLALGVPVSGRDHLDLENQIGLYVNTIVLQTLIEPNKSFLDYLKKNSLEHTPDFEHKDYPFDLVVESLNMERDKTRNPLFDVMIVLQNTSFGNGNVDITKQYLFELDFLGNYLSKNNESKNKKVFSKFDLNFDFLIEPGNKLRLEIEYCTALFNDERIEKMFEAFIHIIADILEDASIPISEVWNLNYKTGSNVIESQFTTAISEDF